MPPRRVTLKDIARAAGVAVGTVSMALAGNPRVADGTRGRVAGVARRLGYVYNRGAGQLRSRRSNIVGVSVCNLVNPYFAEVTAGIEETLDQHDRVVFLGNCAESVARQQRFLETLREYDPAGLLITPAIATPRAHVARIADWGIPVVQVTRHVAGADTDFVGSDNRRGFRLATEHLIALGHRRIGYLGYDRRFTSGRERYAGFTGAMAGHGLPVEARWVVACPATRAGGYEAALALYACRARPTALLCFNDVVAFGALLGLRHLGIEPGRDCSVVGADDVAEAALWDPPLTTVAVDFAQIGHAAGRLLAERIADPGRPTQRIVLEPVLVVRGTAGPPPRAGAKA